jgi:predicted glycosyltransferase involved in capsule biosynthesis
LALNHTDYEYDFAIVTNGEDKLNSDTKRVIDFLKSAGRLGYHHHSEEPLSPPSARELGALAANGKVLFFFDNHCLVENSYFDHAMRDFNENPEIDMLHSATMFYLGEKPCYEYKLQLESNFWASAKPTPIATDKPYRIASGGHGGFAVRRSAWYETGGYWDGFVGYGGEELTADLAFWLLGKQVWIDPRVIHYHYAGDRGYTRHYTDDYFRNMMMSANIIGGEKWLYTVYDSFASGTYPRVMSDKSMFDLLTEAQTKSESYHRFLYSRPDLQHKDLDALLAYFKEHNISF